MPFIVGSDIGGTFTDVVAYDTDRLSLSFGKSLTDNGDLVEGVFSCFRQMEIDAASLTVLKHGTTQVINVLLERRGARTGLVTTKGFRDVLEIGRASRPLPFDLAYRRDSPLVERALRLEVTERLNAKGQVLQPLDLQELDRLCDRLREAAVEAVAVSFLNAYVNPQHEIAAAEFIRERLPDIYVTTAVEHSREWFEYERTSTAVANAYVGPRAARYVGRLESRLEQAGFCGTLLIMGSHGGVLSPRRARQQPIALVESGPIGGCIGAAAYAGALNLDRVIAFDMGGTTAKCALVENGAFDVQPTYYVGGYEHGLPLRTPVLDIVEVGTGGGSIASVDGQGRLHVGPQSAGSDPGPVCFGRGGRDPTVTDANLLLGRIGSGAFLSGSLSLDRESAAAALIEALGDPLGFARSTVDAVASGVLALANAQMGSAIKEITVERGKDIRDFTLFAFGGGGPLHAIDLARELSIRHVVVPPEPGNFSALGMLFAPVRIDELRTVRTDLSDGTERLDSWIAEMEASSRAVLSRDFETEAVAFERQAEMRYKGQRHTIKIALDRVQSSATLKERFLQTYQKRYGRADPDGAIELIGLRVTAVGAAVGPDLKTLHRAAASEQTVAPTEWRHVYFPSERNRLSTPIFRRQALPLGFELKGPAIIEEFGATTVVGPGDELLVGALGELEISLAANMEASG